MNPLINSNTGLSPSITEAKIGLAISTTFFIASMIPGKAFTKMPPRIAPTKVYILSTILDADLTGDFISGFLVGFSGFSRPFSS